MQGLSPPEGYYRLPVCVKCRCVHLYQTADGYYWCCRLNLKDQETDVSSQKYQSPLRDLARQIREVASQHIAFSQVADFMNHIDNHLNAIAYAEEINREKANQVPTPQS